jgi:hypothetical protein
VHPKRERAQIRVAAFSILQARTARFNIIESAAKQKYKMPLAGSAFRIRKRSA